MRRAGEPAQLQVREASGDRQIRLCTVDGILRQRKIRWHLSSKIDGLKQIAHLRPVDCDLAKVWEEWKKGDGASVVFFHWLAVRNKGDLSDM